jgi:hypothetical protein
MNTELDIQRQRAGGGIGCLQFTPIDRRGSLVGFADLHVPAYRIRLFSCTVHEQNGRRWVGLPGRPWVKDGELVRDPDTGKVRYEAILAFDDQAILRRFSDAAVAAIEAYDAGVFR